MRRRASGSEIDPARTPPALREPQDKASVPADGRAPTAAELRLELERIKSQASTSSL